MSGVDALALLEPLGLGRGVVDVVTIADPAPGSHWFYQVGAGNMERVLAIGFDFTADATVANRQLGVQYRDADGHAFFYAVLPFAVTASTGLSIGAAVDVTTSPTLGVSFATLCLPDMFLRPGTTLRSRCANFAGGDDWANVFALVERLPIGPDGYELGEPAEARAHRGRRELAGSVS